MNRLHEKGYIGDPKGKAKSVALSEEGARPAEELFRKHFFSVMTMTVGDMMEERRVFSLAFSPEL